MCTLGNWDHTLDGINCSLLFILTCDFDSSLLCPARDSGQSPLQDIHDVIGIYHRCPQPVLSRLKDYGRFQEQAQLMLAYWQAIPYFGSHFSSFSECFPFPHAFSKLRRAELLMDVGIPQICTRAAWTLISDFWQDFISQMSRGLWPLLMAVPVLQLTTVPLWQWWALSSLFSMGGFFPYASLCVYSQWH